MRHFDSTSSVACPLDANPPGAALLAATVVAYLSLKQQSNGAAPRPGESAVVARKLDSFVNLPRDQEV